MVDPYRWLEDQDSTETRSWIAAENSYTHEQLDGWPGRSLLEKRIAELKKVESIHSPLERNGRLFYRRRSAEQEQYVIYMRQGAEGKEQLLVDPNPMSADHSTNVDIADVSKDGEVLAYMIRKGGKDETEVHLLEVDTRHELPDVLPEGLYFDLSFLLFGFNSCKHFLFEIGIGTAPVTNLLPSPNSLRVDNPILGNCKAVQQVHCG